MDRSRLGPYEIADKLGEGGMGEVYLAQDTRLGRQVAIKVLPPEFAADPDRLGRFEQEARAAAALNHPHIAAIHDVGTDDGVHYMVQEYLRGQTLGEEIADRRMPLERALELGIEIAEALGAAHGAGIVHRDLKPANIFVTEQGHAKVLDFGLAKLVDLAPIGSSDDAQTRSPTVLGTVAGQVMGTAGYMAPEQVEGGEVDGRADIFAFGCVLYEMLAGSRPFTGRSVMQTLDLIVHEDPAPLAQVRKGMPTRLQWVLDKCLAKDPRRRYQDAEDLAVDLRWIATADPEEAGVPKITTAVQAGARSGIPLPAAVAAAVVLVVATAMLASQWSDAPTGETARAMNLEIALPDDIDFSSLGRQAVTINRAGTMIAFTAANQIWIRPLSDTVSTPLRGTEDGGRAPVFSPDGRDLAFWRDGELRRVSVTGGTAVRIALAENPWGMRWDESGWVLYGQGTEGIWRARAAGGEPEQLLAMPDGYLAHGPQLLDDGRLLYTRRPQSGVWDDAEIVVQAPGDPEPRILVQGARDARWLRQGYLVHARGGDVFARRWEGTDGTAPGPSAGVVSGVQSGREITAAAHFDVSDSGTLVYIPGDVTVTRDQQILWTDRDGTRQVALIETLQLSDLALSPDGTRLAVAKADNTGVQIWVYDIARGAGTQLTSGGYNSAPLWSPDGGWIYYTDVTAQFNFGSIYRLGADGSEPPEVVLPAQSDSKYRPEALTADGGTLIVDRLRIDANADWDILLYDIDSGDFEVLADSEVAEFRGRISPDGRYLAYARRLDAASLETRLQIRDLQTRATYPVSADDASYSRWNSDGSGLFYVRVGHNTSDTMMSVAIVAGERLEIGRPRELFKMQVGLGSSDFFVTPDGQRFLYAEQPGSYLSNVRDEVRVVVNWIEELRTRVPEQ